jgi:alginate O-acetyltransferase complex protein AlgI
VLFNSHAFLFFFFPSVLALYFLASRFGLRTQLSVLLAASLFFYAWWDVRFIVLLVPSILGNYVIGQALTAAVERERRSRANLLLTSGVTLNLAVLGVFKYAHFIVDNLNSVSETNFTLGLIILPLGISFFTFEQIGFLIDLRRGSKYESGLLRYALFVSFFPRLVAGPILRYNEIVPQMTTRRESRTPAHDFAVGLTIFFIGLVKKSVLADGIAPYASLVFVAAGSGASVDTFVAWGGALAYTLQLYFDFSGYSDMAIGAARCFGIRFPMNFFSPYKATSIIEFWRRWHITLSRFLRDYLYFSLGGNRRGAIRRYANLLVTMLLGGLWHGASWTFIFWGGLHGCYLMINHAWLAASERSPLLTRFRGSRAGAICGTSLTFLAVVVAWVFFRAPSFAAAITLLSGMIGQHGTTIPVGLSFVLQPIHGLLAWIGITFAEGSGSQLVKTYLWVVVLFGFALVLPSTQEFLARYAPVLEMDAAHAQPSKAGSIRKSPWLQWSPSPGWAIAIGSLAFLGIISITRVSDFLYWQF